MPPPAFRLAPLLCLAALAVFGCGGGGGSDAGTSDAGGGDAGTPDAGSGTPVITFRVTVPASTPANATLDVKGNQPALGNWDADKGLVLTRGADGAYTGSAPFAPGTGLEFKVTRGSWTTVMKTASGGEAPNLTHQVVASATLPVAVEAWADQAPSRPSTLTGTFETLEVPAHAGLAARKALVYLPPGYAAATDRRYPVLYLHDGQNVFDSATAFSGEWRADEAAETLIAEGKVEPLIMVAVYNTSARIDEYTPVRGTGSAASLGGGKADQYGQLLVEVLKPLVDARFRTRTDAASTGLAGSSLGGLVSMYLGMKHPGVFTRLGVVSPSVWWAERDIVARVNALEAKLPLTVWLDIGTAESANAVADTRALRDALVAEGWTADLEAPYGGTDLAYLEVSGAQHNEAAWAARFPTLLQYLFPAPTAP
jgi:predicted alpha/beta superfamily hydrolase